MPSLSPAALWEPPAPKPAPVPCLHAINWECLGVTWPVTDPRPGRATCFGRSAFSDCDLAIAWERGGRLCLVCLCSLHKAGNLHRDSHSLSLGPELWLMSWEHLCIYLSLSWVGLCPLKALSVFVLRGLSVELCLCKAVLGGRGLSFLTLVILGLFPTSEEALG